MSNVDLILRLFCTFRVSAALGFTADQSRLRRLIFANGVAFPPHLSVGLARFGNLVLLPCDVHPHQIRLSLKFGLIRRMAVVRPAPFRHWQLSWIDHGRFYGSAIHRLYRVLDVTPV